jgi:hypothetical protein
MILKFIIKAILIICQKRYLFKSNKFNLLMSEAKITKQNKTKQLRGLIKTELLQLYSNHNNNYSNFIKDTRVKAKQNF